MNEVELRGAIRQAVDGIQDPCALAQGIPIGLIEMGLLTGLKMTADGGGFAVELRLRLTAPGCLYWIYFERELRQRVRVLEGVMSVSVELDDAFDWTPDVMGDRAQALLRSRRKDLGSGGREATAS